MKRLLRRGVRISGAFLLAVFLVAPSAYAVGPSIRASVYDGKPAQMSITAPVNNAKIDNSLITITGSVHNIGQIMVYFDGAYSMTHPLDTGASTYSIDTTVSSGRHTIKLVGINPFDGTTLEESVTFIYTPAPAKPRDEPVTKVVETAQATQEYMEEQVEQASTTGPAVMVSEFAYDIMKSLDIIPSAGTEEAGKMAVRFWSVSTGTALLVLTQPMIGLYHLVRYRLLDWNVHALPHVVQHHAAFVLRAGGLMLLAVGFFI